MIFGREVLVGFGLFIGISSKSQSPFSVKSNLFDPSKVDNLGLTKPVGIQITTV